MDASSEPTRRRRGAALEAAILDAALIELSSNGFQGFTMEAVAARAGASKNSLYRRWPTRRKLALAAVRGRLITTEELHNTGSLRGDLLATARLLAAQFDGLVGAALRVVVAESITAPDDEGWIHDRGPSAGTRIMRTIAERAVERGEIDSAVITERSLEAGPALLRYHFLFRGTPIPDAVLVQIVDEVILPLWTNSDRPVTNRPVTNRSTTDRPERGR